ncbi:MAG: hypothetical protein GC149_10510 [Gammaproteobacteria bacterium]|nr:hypothetical protein [Gammaproteobacteria bacterium]
MSTDHNNTTHPEYKAISRDFAELSADDEFDVVVVGSGYGGSIAASRMARLGKTVCLLERGREILPGQYPDTLTGIQDELQIRTDTRADTTLGHSNAMFDFRLNEEVSVLVGCGLGGTSLINANVALEARPQIFADPSQPWPEPFRNDPQLLAPYYARARAWLGSRPYPNPGRGDGYRYPPLNKLQALTKSAKAINAPIIVPAINVNFEDLADNGHGVPQPRCNNCGDCCSGCNHGAKNTTLMNYLPDAYKHGARIYCNSSVDYIEKQKDGWRVHVFSTRQGQDRITLHAKNVILAAGTLGSTEIMLRSKSRGLPCSDRLGQRFSGNGDVLAFGYNSYWQDNDADTDALLRDDATPRYPGVYAIGRGENRLDESQLPGPCITGCIDLREPHRPLSEHCVVEEGVTPGGLSSILPTAFMLAAAQHAQFLKYGAEQAQSRLQDIQELAAAAQDAGTNMSELCYRGALSRTQTYLCMSMDAAAGELTLADGERVVVKWPDAGASPAIARVNNIIAQVSDGVQGQYLANPLWDKAFGNKLITVHPLGGCCMADTAELGVVNHACQVFADNSGTQLHAGLYICDGSVIPGALAVNPLLTISAITERACDLIAGKPIVDEVPATIPMSERDVEAAAIAREAIVEPALTDEQWQTSLGSWRDLWEFLRYLEREFGELWQKLEAILKELMRELKLLRKEQIKRETLSVLAVGALGLLAQEATNQRRAKNREVPSTREFTLWQLLDDTSRGLLQSFGKDFSQTLQFSETMAGYVAANPATTSDASPLLDPYSIAYAEGKAAGDDHAMTMTLSIGVDDIHRYLKDTQRNIEHVWTIRPQESRIHCPVLFDEHTTIESGSFSLLIADAQSVESWLMEYRLHLQARGKASGFLYGRKTLHCKPGSHWWTDLSELSVGYYSSEQAMLNGEVPHTIGKVTLKLQDFLHQVHSIKAKTINPYLRLLIEFLDVFIANENRNIQTLITRYFGFQLAGVFGMTVFRAYGDLLSDLTNFPAQDRASKYAPVPRPLNAPLPEHHPYFQGNASPELRMYKFRLTRYPGKGIPVILAPGMGVNASSFATPSVDVNLVEFLTQHAQPGQAAPNRDVWLFDYRASDDSGYSTQPFTLDEIAQEDWPQAIDYILGVTGASQVQIVAHCLSSMALLMGLLSGKVAKEKIRSIVSSQLTLHPVTNWLNNAKAEGDLVSWLEQQTLIQQRHGTVSMNSGDTPFDHALDLAMYQSPVPDGEACHNPCCRRVFGIYGPSYLHGQLNHATHSAMADWFKAIHISPFKQWIRIIRLGYVVDAEGRNTYLTDDKVNVNDPNNPGCRVPSLDLPIFFLVGGLNLMFLPETSQRTYDWLCAHNEARQTQYRRRIFEGYGHMDCFIGKRAYLDIFPAILQDLDQHLDN